jgi:RNA polymerase sigma-70 factor (ECF subfamily)
LVYCIIPPELAAKLHETLREHFREDPSVSVVVDMRRSSRRLVDDRRRSAESSPPAVERRRIKNSSGRRVADRRAETNAIVPPALPAEAARFQNRLIFIERVEPSDQEALDADTKRLVTRFQAGEESSFEEIYLRHFGSVYGYAHAAVRSDHDAEDVAQQVFLRALQALPGYEVRVVSFRAWLFRIARHMVLDWLRRSQRIVVEDPAQLGSRQDALGAGEKVDLDWLSEREVAFQVERLPRAQREVIVLRYLLDLRYDEIATLIGDTPRGARHLHTRAIRVLQGRLADRDRAAPLGAE